MRFEAYQTRIYMTRKI